MTEDANQDTYTQAGAGRDAHCDAHVLTYHDHGEDLVYLCRSPEDAIVIVRDLLRWWSEDFSGVPDDELQREVEELYGGLLPDRGAVLRGPHGLGIGVVRCGRPERSGPVGSLGETGPSALTPDHTDHHDQTRGGPMDPTDIPIEDWCARGERGVGDDAWLVEMALDQARQTVLDRLVTAGAISRLYEPSVERKEAMVADALAGRASRPLPALWARQLPAHAADAVRRRAMVLATQIRIGLEDHGTAGFDHARTTREEVECLRSLLAARGEAGVLDALLADVDRWVGAFIERHEPERSPLGGAWGTWMERVAEREEAFGAEDPVAWWAVSAGSDRSER